MLASITPLGERGRGASWRRTVTAYVVASSIGGAAVGALLGTLGALMAIRHTSWTLVVGAVIALVAAFLDITGRLPTLRRQVDETWMNSYRDWVYGAGFGLQLGVGAMTIVTSASLYLTWVVELLTGSPAVGALVGAAFGLSRALPLVGTAPITTAALLRSAQRRWHHRLPVARRATIAVEAAAGVAMLAWVAA
jgi:F0F1-type ATP synthase assembly protein I